jgi:hypothetical protein
MATKPKGEQIIRGKSKNGCEFVECKDSRRIRTIDDLVKAAKIDLSVWDISDAKVNKYEVATMPRATGSDKAGWDRKSTKPMVVELYQIRLSLKPKDRTAEIVKQSHERMLERLAELGKKRVPAIVVGLIQNQKQAQLHMAEIASVDLHMGKYSRAIETNSDYDMDTAIKLFRASTLHALEKCARDPVEKVLWPVGNDAMHFAMKTGTSSHGTPRDNDGRYYEVYERVIENYVWAIEESLKLAPVEFIAVPGNHDELQAYHAARELAAYFRHSKHVTHQIGPKMRKFVHYGINLLGFTHGNREKLQMLPTLMAKEQRKAWGESQQCEWHIGHTHLMRIYGESFAGIRIRILPCLSGHDAWHYEEGYQDRRASESYLWNKVHGYAGHYSFNVNPS